MPHHVSVHRCPLLRRRLVSTWLALAFTVNIATASAQSGERMFIHPPAAQELAGYLFPATFRGTASGAGPARSVAALPIEFEFDSTALTARSLPHLESVGEMLQLPRLRQRGIRIEGHTDAVGEDRYNQRLSERRARAIKAYLVDAFGIDANRIQTVGLGERQLRDADAPTNPINRRVTFQAWRRSR